MGSQQAAKDYLRRAFVYTLDGMREATDVVLATGNPDICVVLSELGGE